MTALFFAQDLADAARDAREHGFDDRERPESIDIEDNARIGGFVFAAPAPADQSDVPF